MEARAPVLVVDEVAQAEHVALGRAAEARRQARLPEEVGAPVPHALHEGYLLGQPCVQRRGANFREVDAQRAVDAAAVEADEDTQVHARPRRPARLAVRAPGRRRALGIRRLDSEAHQQLVWAASPPLTNSQEQMRSARVCCILGGWQRAQSEPARRRCLTRTGRPAGCCRDGSIDARAHVIKAHSQSHTDAKLPRRARRGLVAGTRSPIQLPLPGAQSDSPA